MKNLLFILSVSSLFFFSCSSDADSPTIDNDIVLLKSRTYISNGPTTRITTYTYNDNKLDVIYENTDGSTTSATDTYGGTIIFEYY